MPKIVDHNDRREAVASAALHLIGERGIDNVTLEDISKAAGFSTRIISHYFGNKREMLLFTFVEAYKRSVAKALTVDPSIDDPLLATVEGFLPIDDERARWWIAWNALGSMAVSDARRYMKQGEALQRTLLARDQEAGRIPAGTDLDLAAAKVLALINGCAAMALADPKHWNRKRLRAIIAAEIATIRSGRI